MTRPLEAERAGQEVRGDEHERDGSAGEPLDTRDTERDEQHGRRHERRPLGEVDGDLPLYRRDRVHGLSFSSISVWAM